MTRLHPAKQSNQSSFCIINGEYSNEIVCLTKTIQILKLHLSGFIRIIDKEDCTRNDNKYENNKNDIGKYDNILKALSPSPSSSGTFKYSFYFSQSSSSFMKITNKDHGITTAHCQTRQKFQQEYEEEMTIFRHLILIQQHARNHISTDLLQPLNVHFCEQLLHVGIFNLALSHDLKYVWLMKASQSQEQQEEENKDEF